MRDADTSMYLCIYLPTDLSISLLPPAISDLLKGKAGMEGIRGLLTLVETAHFQAQNVIKDLCGVWDESSKHYWDHLQCALL